MRQNIPQTLDSAVVSSMPIIETTGLIAFLEELSLNAWPALQTVHYDGWALRFANGYTRRANSVNSVFASSLPVDEKIKYCEALFQARGLRPTFKMTPQVHPENLDDILAKKWYQEQATTSVQLLDLSNVEKPAHETVAVTETLTDEWLNIYCQLHRIEERQVATLRRILENIIPRHCFVTLLRDGEAVSVGMAVVERGYVGLFNIVTDERLRGRGLGTQLMQHLLNWGKANGAGHAYLQVMTENRPAQSLYWKLGFREVYQYWYRVKSNN
jgi:ribosomal protein S18 acetylase RimI-like enzyme